MYARIIKIVIIVICIKNVFNNMYGISYFDLSLLTLAVCCGLCVLVAASLVNSLF